MEIIQIIAQNLKRLRTERNYSLGRLAELSGVSKVMLSQIEKGYTNPTINVIWKIANGLKIPYTSLLEEHKPENRIVRKKDLNVQADDVNHYRIYCYYPSTVERNFELFQMEIDSGYSHISIGHSEKSQEYVMVLEGVLTLTVDQKNYVLSANDALCFSATTEHSYQAGDESMVKAIVINFYPL
ncbi:helix-turn-helix domain-containing protein [Scatolibacter rhodanostii]|uniref:helix-turn-helix domain-containing protein n=1 Tax=Scatolibacter rhodanostii TaxID=2014781 RepID=UPI000C084C23|nr:XRE family transcriptional regulator [Scatolibacter rhodanostii]